MLKHGFKAMPDMSFEDVSSLVGDYAAWRAARDKSRRP